MEFLLKVLSMEDRHFKDMLDQSTKKIKIIINGRINGQRPTYSNKISTEYLY